MYNLLVEGYILFQDAIIESDVIDNYTNFNNFFTAFLTLFRMSTGDMWSQIMIDLGSEYSIFLIIAVFQSGSI